MSGNIPEKLIAFQCYVDGKTLIGVVDVDLSGGEFDSSEISGAGIAGTIEKIGSAHV